MSPAKPKDPTKAILKRFEKLLADAPALTKEYQRGYRAGFENGRNSSQVALRPSVEHVADLAGRLAKLLEKVRKGEALPGCAYGPATDADFDHGHERGDKQ